MSVPSQMGRYHVVGQLASGGMAEILLGKIAGPGGFERAIVIKRIHPHLAGETEFVKMFLDEARIISRIQHPNVVQVLELGRDDDELFMAMEYLAGESLLGMMRRGKSTGRPLSPVLSAHVIAKVCAGLHAAHELTDEDGTPLRLVHRDVSPQNVFVTYDGAVKLLDFGIAKFAERVSQTQAGQLKGKFSYMSPEQCRGTGVDRRSDLFSVGVVLFELTTGKRLFHRDNGLETLRAVCDDPIRWPRAFVRGYPEPLEAVLRRALERDPAERYQTAAEMRRDLVSVTRALGLDDVPEDALSEWMRETFGDRLSEKRELLRRIGAGSEITDVPTPEADGSIDIPAVGSGASRPSDTPFTAEAGTPLPPRRERARWLWVALAAGVLIGGIGGALLGRDSSDDDTVVSAEDPGVERRPAVAAPVPEPAGGEAVAGAPTSNVPVQPSAEQPSSIADVVADEPSPEPEEPATVSIAVTSMPRGARIRVDGVERGGTPLTLTLPRGDAPVSITLSRAGYVPWTTELVPDADERVAATLEREGAARRVAPISRREPRASRRVRPARPAPEPAPPPTTTMQSPFRRFQ